MATPTLDQVQKPSNKSVSKPKLAKQETPLVRKKTVIKPVITSTKKESEETSAALSSSQKNQKQVKQVNVSQSQETMDTKNNVVDRSKWKIEVLNGNGNPQAAMKVAALLKEQGFQVVRVDNAGHFSYEKTVLVNWKGTTDAALMVGALLKIPVTDFVLYNRDEKPLKMSIVVGQDRLGLGV